jgi:PAS domain S-box-containing protein
MAPMLKRQATDSTERQLELVLRGVTEAITVQDEKGRLVYANDAAAEMVGFPSAEALLAASPEERMAGFEVLDDDGRPLPIEKLPGRRALAGEESSETVVRYRVRATGEERWSIVRAAPLPIEDGQERLAINTFHDITGRVHAERRLTFLAEASERLGAASLDWEETLHELAELVIPRLADWCIIDVVEDDGRTLRQVTVAAADPHKEQVLREMRSLYQPTVDSPQPAARALREGETQLFPEFTTEILRETTRDQRHFELVTELAPTSAIAVPLAARGHTVGAVTLAWAESNRSYDATDVELAEELARRAALAVDNARLYRAEQEAAARVTFLGEAGRILGSSLEYETTLKRVAELSVPRLGDWCIVDMLDDAGEIERLTIANADSAQVAQTERLRQLMTMDPHATYGVSNAIRTASSQLIGEIDDDLLVLAARGDTEVLELLRTLGPKSSLCVPLIARGRVLGAITLVSTRTSWRFTEEDVGEAEELARRAAIAVDNARLFREAERRAYAARVLTNIGDGVVLLDASGVVRLWNRAAATMTGLGAAEVVGRPIAEAVPGWSAVADLVPVAPAPRPGGLAASLPLELPDRELWLSVSGVAFPEGTVYAFRDLTQERALDQLKSDFVSTVSHELRTPLAAIYGSAQTLRRSDLVLEQEQRDQLLAVVATEADRLARTVDDILWTTRLDSGSLRVAIESCDARALAGDVISAAKTHLPENIRLALDAPDDLPLVAGDPEKVRQVLANLVENAVKYSPDGGDVAVQLVGRDSAVRFSVRDSGLGVPASEQARIFDKFYRVDPEMTRGVGGTGLGLYICRELVRRMNGRIWVESRDGDGSAFTFELPTA